MGAGGTVGAGLGAFLCFWRQRRSKLVVTITFPDYDTENRALAFLLGRFSVRVLYSGGHIVPEAALEALADQHIPFAVKVRTEPSDSTPPMESPP